MMLKGVKIEDTGNYVVQIPAGDYEVDGSNLKLEGYGSKELQVKDIDSIYKIESNRVSVGFTDGSVDVELLCSVIESDILGIKLEEGDKDE